MHLAAPVRIAARDSRSTPAGWQSFFALASGRRHRRRSHPASRTNRMPGLARLRGDSKPGHSGNLARATVCRKASRLHFATGYCQQPGQGRRRYGAIDRIRGHGSGAGSTRGSCHFPKAANARRAFGVAPAATGLADPRPGAARRVRDAPRHGCLVREGRHVLWNVALSGGRPGSPSARILRKMKRAT